MLGSATPALHPVAPSHTVPAADAPGLTALLQQALAHQQRGELAAAERSYREALALAPADFNALHMLGVVKLQQHEHVAAVTLIERAVAVSGGDAAAHSNLGLALQGAGRHEAALAAIERAIALRPDFAEALCNRGLLLQALGRRGEAIADFERALALEPTRAELLSNLGNAQIEQRRYEDAAATFGRLCALSPGYDWADGYLLLARRHACDWAGTDALIARVEARIARGERAITPFAFLAVSDDPALQLACARIHQAAAGARPPPLWRGERYRHDRIRLAYLAADFHDHPVAYLIAELLERHDRDRFEVSAVSYGPPDDGPMRRRLVAAFESFVDVRGRADDEVARMLREREIDIAVDLTGLTHGGRPGILARRPAPVQVNWLGYPGTFGSGVHDYVLADRHVIPPGDERFYDEAVVRLPDTYWVIDTTRAISAAVPTRAEAGLPEAGFVFCCFNNSQKIGPATFASWMRLLDAVPGSALWLLEDNAAASRNLRREAEARGVAASRVAFAPRVPQPAHLARHRLADLFLDTLPYNAHTTASDALWTGLPVVTCTGRAFPSRVAQSQLVAAGLPELVTTSVDDYEALALRLARSPGELAAVRRKLALAHSQAALFDTDRFRRSFEAALTTMWERQQRGAPAAAFDVAPVA